MCIRDSATTRAHAAGHGLVRARPEAAGDAAEQRGTVRGAGVDGDALEGQLQHRRDDPQPQLAARAATAHAPHRGPAAEIRHEVERVAQSERHALEHGTDERAAVVAEGKSDERATRVGIGVRRALAREVGEEVQTR